MDSAAPSAVAATPTATPNGDHVGPPRHAGAAEARAAWLDLALALGLFALTLGHLLPAIAMTPFHRDEARWINHVSFLREWRHPFSSRWQDEGYPVRYQSLDERYRMRDQPPLAPYVFGLGLLVQGRGLMPNGFWIMNQDDAWNEAQGNMPSPADLEAARRTNVVVAALTVVALYVIGKRLTNRAGGVVGALVYAVHPMVEDTASRAWSDPVLVLCVALAAIAAYRLADRPSWPRVALLGALLGLGGAAKLSPLLLGIPLALLGGFFILRGRIAPSRTGDGATRLGWRLVAVPLISWAVFVASYPYLWPNPVTHTYRMFAWRTDSFQNQRAAWPNAAVRGPGDALRRLWDELSHHFSASTELAATLDRHLGTRLGRWDGVQCLDLILAIVGAAVLLALVARSGLPSGQALTAAVLGGEATIVVLGMGVEYARYLLPVLLTEAACIGIAAGIGSVVLRQLLGRLDRRTPPIPALAP